MIDNRLVGKKISSLRQSRGLTQQQLASMMNVSHQAVSKWESGQALPDIQTMLELTRFFGITVEQLISAREETNPENEQESAYETVEENDNKKEDQETEEIKKEAKHMSVQQLLQMAPFMSKETVEEIALEIETPISAAQIAKLAPFVHADCVEKLMNKHKPELSWDTLRRIAPFLNREFVDRLAKDIASGKENVKAPEEGINKTINDIGKAFDDIGRGVGQAVQKAIRFGENVINEVSSAFSDLSSESENAAEVRVRSERAVALRKRAFERAMDDGKWDWIAEHIGELENDAELRGRIAARAREEGLNDWICANLGAIADEYTVDAAIENNNWHWLGEHIWEMNEDMQEKLARAAAEAKQWGWLGHFEEKLSIKGCALEIARTAMENEERTLAAQIAANHLVPDEAAQLCREAGEKQDYESVELLLPLVSAEAMDEILSGLARKQEWERVERFVQDAAAETVESLMEMAVDQGNFDAVDMLDRYL